LGREGRAGGDGSQQLLHFKVPFGKVARVSRRGECRLLRTCKNVSEVVSTRRKQAKRRSLRTVNEHFELVFNEVMTTQVVIRATHHHLRENRTTNRAPPICRTCTRTSSRTTVTASTSGW